MKAAFCIVLEYDGWAVTFNDKVIGKVRHTDTAIKSIQTVIDNYKKTREYEEAKKQIVLSIVNNTLTDQYKELSEKIQITGDSYTKIYPIVENIEMYEFNTDSLNVRLYAIFNNSNVSLFTLDYEHFSCMRITTSKTDQAFCITYRDYNRIEHFYVKEGVYNRKILALGYKGLVTYVDNLSVTVDFINSDKMK